MNEAEKLKQQYEEAAQKKGRILPPNIRYNTWIGRGSDSSLLKNQTSFFRGGRRDFFKPVNVQERSGESTPNSIEVELEYGDFDPMRFIRNADNGEMIAINNLDVITPEAIYNTSSISPSNKSSFSLLSEEKNSQRLIPIRHPNSLSTCDSDSDSDYDNAVNNEQDNVARGRQRFNDTPKPIKKPRHLFPHLFRQQNPCSTEKTSRKKFTFK